MRRSAQSTRLQQSSFDRLVSSRLTKTRIYLSPVNLLQAWKVVCKLRGFTENELRATLTDLHLLAARDALRKVSLARDRRAQLRSVIGHLETAEQGANALLTSKRAKWSIIRHLAALARRNQILLLTACLYVHLDETALALDTLDKINYCDAATGHQILGLITFFFDVLWLAKQNNPAWDRYSERNAVEPIIRDIRHLCERGNLAIVLNRLYSFVIKVLNLYAGALRIARAPEPLQRAASALIHRLRPVEYAISFSVGSSELKITAIEKPHEECPPLPARLS
jgi:hypothetical protein